MSTERRGRENTALGARQMPYRTLTGSSNTDEECFDRLSPVTGHSIMDPPLSKSAQKKAARALRFAELKVQRRAKEKEAKKEKKRIRAEKRAAGELDEDDAQRDQRKKRPKVIFSGKVVVDLGFDHLMSDKVPAFHLFNSLG